MYAGGSSRKPRQQDGRGGEKAAGGQCSGVWGQGGAPGAPCRWMPDSQKVQLCPDPTAGMTHGGLGSKAAGTAVDTGLPRPAWAYHLNLSTFCRPHILKVLGKSDRGLRAFVAVVWEASER